MVHYYFQSREELRTLSATHVFLVRLSGQMNQND